MTDKYLAGEAVIKWTADLTAIRKSVLDVEELSKSAGNRGGVAFSASFVKAFNVSKAGKNLESTFEKNFYGVNIGSDISKDISKGLTANSDVEVAAKELAKIFADTFKESEETKSFLSEVFQGEGFEQAIRNISLPVAVGVSGLKVLAGPIGLAAAGAQAAVSELVQGVDQAITLAEEIGKTANKIGISAEGLQEYGIVAREVGISQEDMNSALQEGGANIDEFISRGTGEAANALEALGLAQDISSGKFKSSEKVMQAVFRKLERVKDGSKRAALAQKIFGEEGGQNLKLALNKGVGAMDVMIARGREMGQVLSEGAVAQASEAKAALSELGATVMGNLNRAFVEASPVITQVTNAIIDVIPTIVDWASSVFGILQGLIGKIRQFFDLFVSAKNKTDETLEKKIVAGRENGEDTSEYEDILRNRAEEDLGEFRKRADQRTVLGLEDRIRQLNKIKEELNAASRELGENDIVSEFDEILRITDLFSPEQIAELRKSGAKFGKVIEEEITRIEDIVASQKQTSSVNADSFFRPKATPTPIEIPVIPETMETDWKALGEDLKTSLLTPFEEYKRKLGEIAELQGNAEAFDAAGGRETFIRARIEALAELAEATENYALAKKALDDAVAQGQFSIGSNIDFEAVARAGTAIRDVLNIEAERAEAIEKQLAVEKRLRLENNAELIKTEEANLRIAKLEKNSTEIERLEAKLRFLRETRAFLQQGQLEGEAAQNAENKINEIDSAKNIGQIRDLFKSGIKAAIDGDFEDFLASKLQGAADSMFDNAIDTLLDSLLKEGGPLDGLIGSLFGGGEAGGLGGGLGGLGGIFGSLLGGGGGSAVAGAAGETTNALGGLSSELLTATKGLGGFGAALGPLAGLTGGLTELLGGDGKIGALFGLIPGLFAGFFADGGVVPRGQFAIVGEQGPEVISAGAAPLRVTPINDNYAATATAGMIPDGGGVRAMSYAPVNNFYGHTQDDLRRSLDERDRALKSEMPGMMDRHSFNRNRGMA